jgi:uncharacterized protein (TIGR02453 family)
MSIKLKLNQEYQEIGSKILFTKESLKFFEDLKQNNHTEWFKNNKLRYDEHVKKPLIRFTEILIEEFKKIEPNYQAKPQDCIFRINRDIRFSKNKNPYKEFAGAYFCIAGKGSELPGLYIEFSNDYFAVAGGIYNPSKEVLKTLRYEIAGNLEVFQSIIYNPTFIEYTGGLARVEQNKILDKFLKPFIEKEPSILNKHFYFWKVLPPEILLSEQLICTVQKIWEVSIPFYKFLKDIF